MQFRQLMDDGVSVIFNMQKVRDDQVRRLFGCLIVSGFEKAALSRDPYKPGKTHHLLVDEFSEFAATSSDALNTILSECRKFRLFVSMAHQTLAQLSNRVQSAVGNAQVKLAFRCHRMDAEVMARIFGSIDLDEIKHEVDDPHALERTHPAFRPMQEQVERMIHELATLPKQVAYVKVGDKPAFKIRMPHLPDPKVDLDDLEPVKQIYKEKLMRKKDSAVFHEAEQQAESKGSIKFGPIKG